MFFRLKKSLDFFENLFQLLMWKNCWKFHSITIFYYTYLYYSFVDHLTIYSRHIVEEKREHFTEKRLDKGPRRRGALIIIISALICTFEFWTKNYFSQRFLSPLAKQISIWNFIYALQGCTFKTTSRKIIK